MTTVLPAQGLLPGASRGPERFASLDAAERLLHERLAYRNGTAHLIEAAAKRARSLTSTGAGDLGPVVLVSQVLPELCLDRGVHQDEIRSLVDATAELVDTPGDVFRLQLAQSAASGRALLELEPERAIDMALRYVFALAPLRQLSLWDKAEARNPDCCWHAGSFPSKRTAELARRVLDGGFGNHSAGLLVGVPVLRGEAPVAALMARPEPGGRARCDAVLRQFAPVVAAQLERRSLVERAETTERRLVGASERRLSRLAFDLHDGALQNVAGITGDLAALRRHVRERLADHGARPQVLGCIDDLEARLQAVDTELRDLCHSLESPAAPSVGFIRMLHSELEAFGRRTDIHPGLEIDGDFDDLTESQRIALWRIVQESLANTREHACAREVRVRARATADSLQVEIIDDGCGFDVRDTLLDAARRGRLGLVGVSERVRLLGGSCDVRSQPGGPTSIGVTLPRWRPQT